MLVLEAINMEEKDFLWIIYVHDIEMYFIKTLTLENMGFSTCILIKIFLAGLKV